MRRLLALIIVLVPCCAPRVQTPVNDPEARAKLQRQADAIAKIEADLAAANADLREACEFRAGDCLMESREKRQDLLHGRTFLECDSHVERQAKDRCEEEKLLERGEYEEVSSYYGHEQWCLNGMHECVAQLADQAAAAKNKAMVTKRRGAFFGSEIAMQLDLDLVVAKEQLKYVRTTLPMDVSNACEDLPEVATCTKSSKGLFRDLDKHLAQSPDGYDEKQAEQLLRQAKEHEIECVHLEQECVEQELGKHGATPQTRRLLQQNLALLGEREQLRAEVDPATADACLRSGWAPEEAYLLTNFQQYAQQQVAYFRIQMHKSFLRVHRAQIACLKSASANPG